jgi:TldD protein
VADFAAWIDAAERASALADRAGLEAEVRAERFLDRSLSMVDGTLHEAKAVVGAGLGVRVHHRGRSGYASTTRPAPSELRRLVVEAARMAGTRPRTRGVRRALAAPSAARGATDADDDPELDAKLEVLRRATTAGRDAGKDVAASMASYRERLGERFLLRTDGARARWEPRAVTLDVNVVSKSPQGLAKGRDFHGGSVDLRDFAGDHSPEALAERAAHWAAERIDARRPPAGRAGAVIDPLLAGVLAHESFGHLAEGDLVNSGWSMLAGKVGDRLGSRHATIRDTGLPPQGAGGIALPFDDEGTPSREVTILDRGKLAGFLHDRDTAAQDAGAPAGGTGNARALDYRFAPICRMRNTYVAAGDRTLEELLEELRDGILACGSTGGEARSDGNFMFTVVRAYRVERGEVAEPLRDVAILGHVLQFLRGIQAAGKELRILGGSHVNCGKFGQWPLPVAYGGPHLLVKGALFGGEGASWGRAA